MPAIYHLQLIIGKADNFVGIKVDVNQREDCLILFILGIVKKGIVAVFRSLFIFDN